jgi:hypothetical protein
MFIQRVTRSSTINIFPQPGFRIQNIPKYLHTIPWPSLKVLVSNQCELCPQKLLHNNVKEVKFVTRFKAVLPICNFVLLIIAYFATEPIKLACKKIRKFRIVKSFCLL